MKNIKDYVNSNVEGWNELEFLPEYSFLNPKLGLQVIMTIDNHGFLNCIHLSIAPVRHYKVCSSDEEYEKHIIRNAADIINAFFGKRQFARAPNDEKNPTNKHFFALLNEDE